MRAARMRAVPNQPKRKSPRNIRVPDELWEAARRRAEKLGTKISVVIRKALEDFVNEGDEK